MELVKCNNLCKEFDNKQGLLQNAKEVQNGMFKIPKVIN